MPGSSWALEMAKHNLVRNYFLVGVTEELEDFVAMLEYSLPRLFRGALDLYVSGGCCSVKGEVGSLCSSLPLLWFLSCLFMKGYWLDFSFLLFPKLPHLTSF